MERPESGPAMAVTDLESQPGEVSFVLRYGGREGRVRFWGDLPPTSEPPVETALATALLPAMTAGGTLALPSPIDPRLRRALPDIQAVLALIAAEAPAVEAPLRGVEVAAPEPRAGEAAAVEGNRVAAFFSGGIDSLTTLLSNPDVTELIYVHGFDIPIDRTETSAVVERRLAETTARWGRPLRVVRTDMRALLDPFVSWDVAHGPALAAVALLFAPTCERVLIASTASYATLAPRGSHPLHDHLWTTERCAIEHHGAHMTRGEKTMLVAEHEAALDVLRVCWEHPDRYNCGSCEKCLRTMVLLEVIGALERCPTFPDSSDPEAIAALSLVDDVRALWVEALGLARERSADPRLVEAIEACLSTEEAGDEGAAEDETPQLEQLLSSRSWRLTSPLRRIGAAARRLRRRGAA